MKKSIQFAQRFLKITCIVDNEYGANPGLCEKEFGLSYLIETNSGKSILFDFGESESNLAYNSLFLDIDLAEIDMAFLSHPHYDHSGGIHYFSQFNIEAPIYYHPKIEEDLRRRRKLYYSNHDNSHRQFDVEEWMSKEGDVFTYIGIEYGNTWEETIKSFVPIMSSDESSENDFCGSLTVVIDEDADDYGMTSTTWNDRNIHKFDELIEIPVENREYDLPIGSEHLFYKTREGDLIHDKFDHEINLMIIEDGKRYLFSGCGHNGIINIMKSSLQDSSTDKLDAVFGGFHMKFGDQDYEHLSQEILNFTNIFYCGHCTGFVAYNELLDRVGEENIKYFGTGDILHF